MSEKIYGKDALRQLPFKDVVLPFDEALKILTETTKRSFLENIDTIISNIDRNRPGAENFKLVLESNKSNVSKILSGGSSFAAEELQYFYDQLGNQSFEDLNVLLMQEVFPGFFNDKSKSLSREPGIICLGYILDLLQIIKPDIADYKTGVGVVAEAARRADFSPMMLGGMVDDSIRLRGSIDGRTLFDQFISKSESERFRNEYLEIANSHEKELFLKGEKITRSELILGTTGFSLS